MPQSLSDFDYDLPQERIAQEPLAQRDASRLLVYDRTKGQVSEHSRFRELARHLPPKSLLLLNDTRVIPARLLGQKSSGAKVEALLIRREEANADDTRQVWQALTRTKGLSKGGTFTLAPGVVVRLLDTPEEGGEGVPIRRISIEASAEVGGVSAAISQIGQMPLPPYIQRGVAKESDKERYQTVFAQKEGSCAAPTAGLHFTPELLASLKEQGVQTAQVTLHVGPGTFLPIKGDDISKHKMHSERFEISQETSQAIERAKQEGRAVVAVGTTVVRTLESAAAEDGKVRSGVGETCLFITPGFRFRVIDALITNFHLPKSTLLMLVAAFGGREGVMRAYQEAIEKEYRFYSYGDAMLLI